MTVLLAQQVREELESPFPEWVDPLARFLFTSVPREIQIAGAVLAFVVFVLVVWLAWRRRRPIAEWFGARRAAVQGALIAAGAILVTAAAAFGWRTWDYMHGDNDFCMSCHVMDVPFERFTQSEHSELQCHDCHQQSVVASARQVYLWVVDRPEEISPHAPVPNRICAECHITEDPENTWERISATAGHRVHLESDSLPNLMCVNCHGVEVHRFLPVDETCGQSGCHPSGKTEIVLGDMAGQSGLHCVSCHAFTAPVSEDAARDTARAALVPQQTACLACHEMTALLVGFDPAVEPHGATCGICHDPHTQEAPEAASETCAVSACHARADTLTPFHRGLPAGVADDCVECHQAHTFVVEGSNCVACHGDIPHETMGGAAFGPPGGAGFGLVHDPGRPVQTGLLAEAVALHLARFAREGAVQQADPFDHATHREIPCADCHSSEEAHGVVEVRTSRDCQLCHHTGPVARRGCESCHEPAELGPPMSVDVVMALGVWARPRGRTLGFDHAAHAEVACTACHRESITLAASRSCEVCHGEHHAAGIDCTACHGEPPAVAHPLAVHTEGCAGSGCHESASYGPLARGRETCLACHGDLAEHRPGRPCAECHRIAELAAGSGASR